MYDVAIIGGGVSGASASMYLSRFDLKVCVLEKEEDVCCGTSKANSAIVHAGYDCKPGTLMAKLNVKGNQMMPQLSKDLDVPFKKCGSLVVATKDDDLSKLDMLLKQGEENNIKGLKILNREELFEKEPNMQDDAVAALYAPMAGIVCPFILNMAYAENAAENGVEYKFDTEVKDIEKMDSYYKLSTNNGDVLAKVVVNAAGVYADKFHNMVSEDKIHITPRRGDYFLLDKGAGKHVNSTIFQLPGKFGKGVLVSPTVHGNIIVGPTAYDIDNKEGENTTAEGLGKIKSQVSKCVKDLPLYETITSFAGLRAHEDGHEFIIEELKDAKGFVDCAGIESPGLASSPAIGEMVCDIVCDILKPEEKTSYKTTRKGIIDPESLSFEEKKALIEENPAYGQIICRCEKVTEGEIIDAIHRPLGAKSLDGVKRRTRAGMGRCQSGFCAPKTMEIIARELNVSIQEITKSGKGSRLIVGENKEL